MMIRYADDCVCTFQYKSDAKRFYRAMQKRLEKSNLQVAPEKTALRRFSRFSPSLVNRFQFLSVEYYWDTDYYGELRVKRRTAPKRLQAGKQKIKGWIKEEPLLEGKAVCYCIEQKVGGALQLLRTTQQ